MREVDATIALVVAMMVWVLPVVIVITWLMSRPNGKFASPSILGDVLLLSTLLDVALAVVSIRLVELLRRMGQDGAFRAEMTPTMFMTYVCF